MSIIVQCRGCQKKLKAKDELAGKRVKCPVCGQMISVTAKPSTDQKATQDDSAMGFFALLERGEATLPEREVKPRLKPGESHFGLPKAKAAEPPSQEYPQPSVRMPPSVGAQVTKPCEQCQGNGKCPTCKGTGIDPVLGGEAATMLGILRGEAIKSDCVECDGNGKCIACGGRGTK